MLNCFARDCRRSTHCRLRQALIIRTKSPSSTPITMWCDNVVMSQNGHAGDNDSPNFAFHSANGGTPTTPMTTAGAGLVTDADYQNGGPLPQNEWMHIACVVAQHGANDSTSSLAAGFSCYFNGRPTPVMSFNYAVPPFFATTCTTPGGLHVFRQCSGQRMQVSSRSTRSRACRAGQGLKRGKQRQRDKANRKRDR